MGRWDLFCRYSLLAAFLPTTTMCMCEIWQVCLHGRSVLLQNATVDYETKGQRCYVLDVYQKVRLSKVRTTSGEPAVAYALHHVHADQREEHKGHRHLHEHVVPQVVIDLHLQSKQRYLC